MIYFDRLFAIKKNYKAALDEDAKQRAKIEQDWHDGYVTDLYKNKALQELDAAAASVAAN